jgi:sporulation protein YlmC with PRC-barrel domain
MQFLRHFGRESVSRYPKSTTLEDEEIRACPGQAQPFPRATNSLITNSLILFLGAMTMLVALLYLFESKTALSQEVQLVKVDLSVVANGYRASELIGHTVTNDKNEKIGKVDDLIVDRKNVLFAVLEVGGFLGIGAHLVVVPYDSLVLDETGQKIELPGASKEQLKALSEFKYHA